VLYDFADPGLTPGDRPKKYVAPSAAIKWGSGASRLVAVAPIGDFLLEMSLKLKQRASVSG
jgi:hypothetical protein